jgi:HPt (histidine-containing phosphotransfer) domain-containing protein
MMKTMRQILLDGDTQRGSQIAHSLKGSSGWLAAGAVHQQAAHLEILFRDGQLETARAAVAELEQRGKRLIEKLRAIQEN